MVNSEKEYLPFHQIKTDLRDLCLSGQSGDLRLFTEDKHTAVISLYQGEIVGLRYRISRGMDAAKLISAIGKAKIKFQKSEDRSRQATRTGLPPTVEILKALNVELDTGTLQEFGKKVLVVEDSLTQRNIICRMLAQNGYYAMVAKDGFQALDKISEEAPDLILLDLVMPGIDGYKVMAMIKEQKGMEHIPIIMLTSRDTLLDKMRGKLSGTDEYLTKPFKSEELMEKIKKHINNTKNEYLVNARA